ncbi:hypothetical protein DyAD56_08305 [Dyella sp. AD56]|uniref:energy transducer TonB n=1 Tax=Dyella sp. AD56 TaxID=1528744 RepID=UPI000C83AF65|nr:energy transducer TonB [Dyella sp. AD56]PMQ05784.1 hypothetical protein DyAD56_08305 [Dyella sp. AD56]
MKYLVGIALFFTLSLPAWADGPEAARKRLELSMLITGTMNLAADGSVRSYALDEEERLPAAVVDLIHRSAQGWHFAPISPIETADSTSLKMSLRVVSHRQDDGNYAMALSGATFDDKHRDDNITVREMVRPTYPLKARQGRVFGTVYTVLRLTRDGHVSDAAVEQVNIGTLSTDNDLRDRRAILAKAALDAIKQWTFNVPTVGPQAANDHWLIRIPVAFHLMRPEESESDWYGQWLPYVPGPQESIPWLDKAQGGADSSLDAVADGQIHLMDESPRLITPLSST